MIEAKENKQKSTEWVTVNDDEYPQSQNVLFVKFYLQQRKAEVPIPLLRPSLSHIILSCESGSNSINLINSRERIKM